MIEILFFLVILAVQNERQPRNSAQVRPDSIDFNCDGNGTTVSVMHHRPTNSNSASSPGEGSTSSTKQDGNSLCPSLSIIPIQSNLIGLYLHR